MLKFVETYLLLILLIIHSSNQKCTDKCLNCSDSNICNVCNFLQGYYDVENDCVFKKSLFCVTYDETGICQTCEKGYFLDQFNLCNLVYDNSLIAHCEDYSNLYECAKCEDGYNLKDGKCVLPEKLIKNCAVYNLDDSSKCKTCKDNFFLDDEKVNCLEVKLKPNCAVHSYYQCIKCNQGFEIDNNLYLESIFNLKKDFLKIFFNVFNQSKFNKLVNFNFNVCKPILLKNCQIFKENKQSSCEKCQPGFFLTPNLACEESPVEPIPNCASYNSQDICEKCELNFFMKSANECLSVIAIPNCLEYNRSIPSPTTLCIECNLKYYLDSTGVCVLRTLANIEFCLKNKIDSEKCELCYPEYILNTDGNKCLHEVIHCDKYISLSSEPLVCDICTQYYYYDLSKKMCLSGNILNCNKYKKNEEICVECKNGYFVNNGVCEQHLQLRKCDIYDQTQKNQCKKCLTSSILFGQKNICIPKTALKNCSIYDNSSLVSKCKSCYFGYVVNQSGFCEAYDDPNCKTISASGVCVECKNNLLLFTPTNQCIAPYDYKKIECSDFQLLPNNYQCNSCRENSYPIEFEKGTVCVPNNDSYYQEITFCEIYAMDGNKTKCIECQNPLSIDIINQKCSPICLKTKVIISLSFLLNNNETIKKSKNECLDVPSLLNCENAIQSSISNNLVCFLCKKDANGQRLTHFDFSANSLTKIESHIAEYRNRSINSITFSPLNKFNPVLCGHGNALPTYYNVSTNPNPIPDCELYDYQIINNFNEYKCVRCKIGYTGVAQAGYINFCNKVISDCNQNIYYKNLTVPDNYESPLLYSSCFKCNNNKYPVLYLKKDVNRFQIVPFDITLPSPNLALVNGYSDFMKCLYLTNIDFNLADSDIFNSIPLNCGLVFYLVDKQKVADINQIANLSIMCGGCKPGYKPIYTSKIITDCVAIENCNLLSSNNLFYNSCGNCLANFSFRYDITLMKIDNSACVANPEFETCEIYNTENNKCVICNDGFYLNYDGKCDIIKIPNCNFKKFINSKIPYSPNSQDFSYSIYKALIGHGCSECANGFIKFSIQEPVCLSSDYLKTTDLTNLTTTNFIPNCKYYNSILNGQLKCIECKTNFIVLNPGLVCIDIMPIMLNCKIALTPNTCKECLSSYLLINGLCEKPNLPNCKEYHASQNQQTCSICENEYFLLNNTCIKGNITGCNIYSGTTCVECQKSFQKIILKNLTYCYPIPNFFNCLNFSTASFLNFELSCEVCEENFFISSNSDDFDNQICLEHQLVSNCVKYDFQNNFSTSTLSCLECQDYFYLKNNVCEKRNNKDYNCLISQTDDDSCQKCNYGYYLNASHTKCLPNPEGIYGCSEYKDKYTCLYCKKGFYFLKNTCIILPQGKEIVNCVAYDGGFNCLLCSSGFIVKNNQCLAIVATNCLTASDETTCATCNLNYGLQKIDNITNCVIINIPNCDISTQIFPFSCLQCEKKFFLNQGNCNPVQIVIDNCMIYDLDQKCSICENNLILNKTRDLCSKDDSIFQKVDINCVSILNLNDPVCKICEFGYFKDNKGDCSKCKNDSCFACHASNNKECYLCNENYYQNTYGGDCLPLQIPTPVIITAFIYLIKGLFLLTYIYF